MAKKSKRINPVEQGNPEIRTLADALALASGNGDDGASADEEALDAIHARIDTRYGGPEGVERLSPGERGLIGCRNLLDEVHNGGLHQYLWNSAGDDAEEARSFLRCVGLVEVAGIFDHVAQFFPEGRIPRDRQARQTRLQEIEDEPACSAALDRMSRVLVDVAPAFPRVLLRYVEAHRDEFDQPSDELVREGVRSQRLRELQGVRPYAPDLKAIQAVTVSLERLAAEVTESNTREAIARVRGLVDDGRKAEAIMFYRQHFACTLPEAKEAVERLQRSAPPTEIPSIEGRLEAAVRGAAQCRAGAGPEYEAAIEALAQIVKDLSGQGFGREAIRDRFLAFDRTLRDQGREMEQAILEDAIDMLTGCFHGRNWEIPE